MCKIRHVSNYQLPVLYCHSCDGRVVKAYGLEILWDIPAQVRTMSAAKSLLLLLARYIHHVLDEYTVDKVH